MFYVQPNIQFIINPSAQTGLDNALEAPKDWHGDIIVLDSVQLEN